MRRRAALLMLAAALTGRAVFLPRMRPRNRTPVSVPAAAMPRAARRVLPPKPRVPGGAARAVRAIEPPLRERQQAARQDPRWARLEGALGIPPILDLSDPETRREMADRLLARARAQKLAVARSMQQQDGPARWETDGVTYEFIGFRHGTPLLFHTCNRDAAISTATDLVRQTAPYNQDGSGIIAGVWDGGSIRGTHQEFGGRVTNRDGSSLLGHATHVGGTVGAAGVVARAKGMAPAVTIDSYDWNYDQAEVLLSAMAQPGEPGKIQVSNHSYSSTAGWESYAPPGKTGKTFWGVWGHRESNVFGVYDLGAAGWDWISYNAPYYLMFKAAGNDRADSPPNAGTSFWYYEDGWKLKLFNAATDPYRDGWDNGGFDTVSDFGNAKNIVTVGAVDDANDSLGGPRDLAQAGMLGFSAWGPSDDGRVKPDIVANGAGLYSTYWRHDADYANLSGTSMSSPSTTGSAVLLAQQYLELFGVNIRNNTLKGLLLHAADDMGHAGPDYKYGWGMLNTQTAAELMRRQTLHPEADILYEGVLSAANPTDEIAFLWNLTNTIKVTVCWTDPPGEPQWQLDVREAALVNDLDLRVIEPGGATHTPYVLDVASPASPATRGDNRIDNVEQVEITTPPTAGVYTATLAYKGSLFGGAQHYAVWISGSIRPPQITHVPPQNTTATNTGYSVDAEITSMDPLNTNALWLCWNTNGSNSAFASNRLARVSNDLYRAQIPPQALGTTLHYYLLAHSENGWAARHPTNAPTVLHHFAVTPGVWLAVTNQPAPLGVVTPDYGSHLYPSGITVQASALWLADETMTHRYRNAGWNGGGSVPVSGTTNQLSFDIATPSQLSWQWQEQWVLRQTSSVAALWEHAGWWDAGQTAITETAAAVIDGGTTTYRFTEWRVDGLRQPDATNRAVNPVGGIGMTTARTAVAVFLPEPQDDDGDGLNDWWERFYFGSTNSMPGGDDDGDGAANTNELADGSDPRDAGSIPTPPVILHIPLADPQNTPAPWTVNATVTDNHAVAAVELQWRRNGAGPWQNLAMQTAGSGVYTHSIPTPGLAGDTFEYRITAADTAGANTSNGVHTFSVSYPLLDVTPADLDYVLLPNRITNAWLAVTNSGTTGLAWHVAQTVGLLGDDMEAGTNDWQHGGASDLWHIATRRASSGAHAWYCGLDAGAYGDNMAARLVSAPITLGSNSRLQMMHWIDAETAYAEYVFDGGMVEISTNMGASFAQISPQGGYPSVAFPHASSPWPDYRGCFATVSDWTAATFDLSAFDGMTVQLGFSFISDGGTTGEGWYLDDLLVESDLPTNTWLTVTPWQGALAAGGAAPMQLQIDSAGLAPGKDLTGFIHFGSNDPLQPTNTVSVTLRPRTIPTVAITAAAQTSTDGHGHVTVSNLVHDADRETCALELLFSTNNAASWAPVAVRTAAASLGAIVFSNGTPQVAGILTRSGYGSATNRLQVAWGTTNSIPPLILATNVILRARAWDGRYWSPAVTSQTFLVDNQAPALAPDLAVSSHTVGSWSSNLVLAAHWTGVSDGLGIGVAGYGVGFTSNATPAPEGVNVAGLSADRPALNESSNWWVAVRAIDAYGNAGPETNSGPYWIDATPPADGGATVSVLTDPSGAYVVGAVVTSAWSGFVDPMSGIAGYYYALSNAAPTANAAWATGSSGVLVSASGQLEQTNTVYVWARDQVGRIGQAAHADVLMLDPVQDFDQDGHTTAQEQTAGTDAAQAGSVLRFIMVTNAPGATNAAQIVLRWPSASGRMYGLYERADLTHAAWLPLAGHTNLAGTGGYLSRTAVVDHAEVRFYRIGVTQP